MKGLIFVLLLSQSCFATTYFVKSAGGTGSGLDDANAWSYAKYNSMSGSLQPGDIVKFNKGETYYGALVIASAGASGNVITYDSYGTGSAPIISGLTALSSWTLSSGNIYYASFDVPSLNLVTLDGVAQKMGRYPNTGYLLYSTHSGNASITGTSIGTLPFNPANSEVVIRKNRWILDRHPVTSRSGNTLNISTNTSYGSNSVYSPVDGNGYFIQNNLSALDQEGEWFYDTAANRLYMHFGVGTPSGRTVKASSVIRNVYVNYWSYLTFNNLTFEGANIDGAYIIGTNNIAFNNCKFENQGGNGIYGIGVNTMTITNCNLLNCQNNGIWVEDNGSFITADGVVTYNTGTVAGAGRSGDGAQEGISINGSKTVIKNCSVTKTGYSSINFTGNSALVKNNVVDSFCLVKDDGGGIYTYSSDSSLVRSNIILNAIGAFEGAESYYYEPFGKAAGVYLDDGTANHNATVDSNTVANGNWIGIFINGNGKNKIFRNIVYNYANGLHISEYSTGQVRNLNIKGNQFIAKTSNQYPLYVHFYVNESAALLGSMDSNVYARPIDDNLTMGVNNEYSGGSGESFITLANWKSSYSQDPASTKSPTAIGSIGRLRFDYNATGTTATPSLGVLSYKDLFNVTKSGSISLPAYSGSILLGVNSVKSLKNGAGKTYKINGKFVTIIQ